MTAADINAQIITSAVSRYSMDAEAKSAEHTSPATLDETGNMLIIRYPTASAPTDITATAASPFSFAFLPVLSKRIAAATVMGITIKTLSVRLSTVAIAVAPKATWERPSPINEKRFSTRITPKSAEQRAMRTPTARADHTIS